MHFHGVYWHLKTNKTVRFFFMSNGSDVTHNSSEMHWLPKRHCLQRIKTVVRRIHEMYIYLYGSDVNLPIDWLLQSAPCKYNFRKMQTTYQRLLRNFWSEISLVTVRLSCPLYVIGTLYYTQRRSKVAETKTDRKTKCTVLIRIIKIYGWFNSCRYV